MDAYLRFFTPAPEQLAGLGAVALVCIGMILIGAVAGTRKRLHETDLVVGWATIASVFVIGGVVFGMAFTSIAIIVAAIAVAALLYVVVRDRGRLPGDLLRTTLLALPAIWLAGCMAVSQWDEFTNWLPNARFIYVNDGFPGIGMPESTSALAAYPYGQAFIVYLSSHLAGQLVENATTIVNIVLLAMLGLMIGRIIRRAVTKPDTSKKVPLGLGAVPPDNIGWVYCALGGLAATALSPTFVPKIVFTAYADTSTAVLLGMAAILMWMLLNSLAGEDREFSANHIVWRLGFIAVALVAVKQANLILFAILVASGLIAALRDPAISVARFSRLVLPIVLMPVAMYLLWRFHVQANDVAGEFSIAPASKWLVDEIGTIAARMASIASKKGGHFGLMLIATALAVRGLWRIRTPFDRMSLIVGGLFVGYTLFLLFAYVTAFSEGEALRAASYWRYNMHLGGASAAFAGYGAALLWRRWSTPRIRRGLGWVAVLLMVAAPFAVAHKIRFDLRPAKIYVRATAERIVDIIPDGARTAILDLGGNGAFGVIARYVISTKATLTGEMTASAQPTETNIRRFIAANRPDYIWLHYTTEPAKRALEISLDDGASHLLRRTDEGWRVVDSWPYPGYDNPYVLPD